MIIKVKKKKYTFRYGNTVNISSEQIEKIL